MLDSSGVARKKVELGRTSNGGLNRNQEHSNSDRINISVCIAISQFQYKVDILPQI
jgi:hypothetical protein